MILRITQVCKNFLLLLFFACFFISAFSINQFNSSKKGFTENKGQVIDTQGKLRNDIKYSSFFDGLRVYFREDGFSYVLTNQVEPGMEIQKSSIAESLSDKNTKSYSCQRVDIDFVGASKKTTIRVEKPLPGVKHFVSSSLPATVQGAKSYEVLVYENLYPNVDLVFYHRNNGLEYDIRLNKNAHLEDVKFKYNGANALKIENEKLIIKTTIGELQESIPAIYANGLTKELGKNYVLKNDVVSFRLDNYNPEEETIVDPWVTYFGGGLVGFCSSDISNDICIDNNKNSYISGWTCTVDFPASPGAYQSLKTSFDPDLFITKFDPSGIPLWSTYYGGTDVDEGHAICFDGAGAVFVGGLTYSFDFPNTAGFYQPLNVDGFDGFVLKLDANSGQPLWATYYGGNGVDFIYDIKVAANGDIIIAGATSSNDLDVPIAAYQNSNAGSSDVFIASLNASGTAKQWASYFGGTNDDFAFGVTIDQNGDIAFAGATGSADFPVLGNAKQTSFNGPSYDAFLTKIDGLGNPIWSTFVGGTDEEFYGATDVVSDSKNDLILVGLTLSTDFPISNLAFQSTFGSSSTFEEDGFVMKFKDDGTLKWSTYYGGDGIDWISSVAVDQADDIFITGDSRSANLLTTTGSFQTAYGGGVQDYFFARFDPLGNQVCSSYIGGTANDFITHGGGIDVDDNYIYITGTTSESDFPVTQKAYQTQYNGGFDAFVAQICKSNCGYENVKIVNVGAPRLCVGLSTTIDVTGSQDYFWSPSAGLNVTTGSMVTATPAVTTTYTVSGLCSSFDTVTIFIDPIPIINISILPSASICSGTSAMLSASSSLITNNAGFMWLSDPFLSSNFEQAVASPSLGGVYTYSLLGTSTVGGCNNAAIIDLTVFEPKITASSSQTVCAGESAILTANATESNYQWSPNTFLSTSTGSSVTCLPASVSQTDYTVSISDANNCIAAATLTITSVNDVAANAGVDQTICSGSSTQLTASGATSYLWESSDGIFSASISVISVAPTITTSYNLTAINGACKGVDTALVVIDFLPTIVASPDISICKGEQIALTASGNNNHTIVWSSSSGLSSSFGNYITASPFATTTYTASANSSCGISASIVTVSIFTDPFADFLADPDKVGIGAPTIQFYNKSISGDSQITNWEWDFGFYTTDFFDKPNTFATFPDTGTYVVTLVVIDANGCTDTTVKTIRVDGEFLFFVPTSFSPNEDGVNDLFRPEIAGAVSEDYQLIIVDRWGNVVFESKIMGQAWNGQFGNVPAPEDVYTCKTSIKDINNTTHQYIGTIVLIR